MPYAYDGTSVRPVTGDDALWDGEVIADESSANIKMLINAYKTKLIISELLDRVARLKGYDGIVSCASYATSADATFRAEAEAAIAWRDAVYRRGYEILADIPDGVTTPDEVLALLPKPEEFGWPAA